MEGVLYRNQGWNVKMAFYMAWHGISLVAAPVVVLVYFVVPEGFVSGVLMAMVIVPSAAIPFLRALTGRVWVEDGYLCSRNAFLTVRHPLSDVSRITTRALWQNFFVVGAIESASRGPRNAPRLIPVPAEDADVLTTALDRIRNG